MREREKKSNSRLQGANCRLILPSRFGAVHRRLDQNFDRIAHLAKDILKCKWGLINLVDEEEG